MQIISGYNRRVFIFPKLGFVIKVPRFYIRQTSVEIFHLMKGSGRWERIKWELSRTTESYGSLCRFWFLGLEENCREFFYYISCKNPLLQPTYFSFFGFFNVQKYGNDFNMDPKILWSQIVRITAHKAWEDSHQFSNPSNFVLVNGKAKMIDYGSRRAWPVIRRYGLKIADELDPNFEPPKE